VVIDPSCLGPVRSLAEKVKQMGHGIYLLTEYSEREGGSGQSRLQLTLDDATGRVTGFVWPEARDAVLIPPIPSPVSVLASVQIFDGKPQLKVQCLAGLSSAHIAQVTELLPRYRFEAPVLPAFDRLARLERDLPAPLNGFLREVFLDPVLGMSFLRCRASVQHHHAYVGGLLVHSTELLDMAEMATHLLIPDDVWSPYLAQLGYLLHDLGKLKSVGEARRGLYGLTTRHETLTIELLAPHLRWLEQRDPKLAAGLRSIFDFLATPFSARRIPRYLVAEIVATLDQWSAAAHHRRDLAHLLSPHIAAAVTSVSAARPANDPLHAQETRHAS
jgi:hypothetical protein